MSVGETGPHDSKEDAGSADVLADPALQAFVDPSFDSTQYASSVLKNPKVSATEKTHMLQAWVIRLDEAIQEEVTSKQEELFSHVRQLQVSDRSLQAIRGSVSSFHEDLKQLRSEAQGPFQLMAQHTTEPRNLHETLQLLRAVNSRMKQTGKLQQVMQTRIHIVTNMVCMPALAGSCGRVSTQVTKASVTWPVDRTQPSPH